MDKYKDIILNAKYNNEDYKYIIIGTNCNDAIEYQSCYTYQQCNEIIYDMKYEGYKDIRHYKLSNMNKSKI